MYHDFEAKNEENKDGEEPVEDNGFRDCLIEELQAACRNIPLNIKLLCQKYLRHVAGYGSNAEIESGNELLPSCVLQFDGEEKPSIYEFYQIEKRLRELLSK